MWRGWSYFRRSKGLSQAVVRCGYVGSQSTQHHLPVFRRRSAMSLTASTIGEPMRGGSVAVWSPSPLQPLKYIN